MLLCNNSLFLPSLSISGGSIELELWSLIGQSICDVRQQTRLYGPCGCTAIGKWPIACHPWSVLACEVGPVDECFVAVDVGVVEPGKFSLTAFFGEHNKCSRLLCSVYDTVCVLTQSRTNTVLQPNH